MNPKLGTFSILDGYVAVEILSQKLDFLILDSEHGLESLSEQRIRYIVSKQYETEIFIRVECLNRIQIQKTLEIKPEGIMIPQIRSLEDAKKAVSYSFFPPDGTRGISPYTRSFDYINNDIREKKINCNKNLKLSLLIEGLEGIESLPLILENYSKYIHMIYFGFFDFCNSVSLEPNIEDHRVQEAIHGIVGVCKKFKINVGTIAPDYDSLILLKKLGIDYIVYKNDTELLIDGLNIVTK